MQTDKFLTWLVSAKPNQQFVYYEGMSLTDTLLSVVIQKALWSHACRGYVYLVQKKLRVGLYMFIAIKASSPPIKKLVPLAEPKDRVGIRTYTKHKDRPEPLEVSTHG